MRCVYEELYKSVNISNSEEDFDEEQNSEEDFDEEQNSEEEFSGRFVDADSDLDDEDTE